MTKEERKILNMIKDSKESGSYCYECYDFNANRPESKDFWEELEKLGKVERDNLMYSVQF